MARGRGIRSAEVGGCWVDHLPVVSVTKQQRRAVSPESGPGEETACGNCFGFEEDMNESVGVTGRTWSLEASWLMALWNALLCDRGVPRPAAVCDAPSTSRSGST